MTIPARRARDQEGFAIVLAVIAVAALLTVAGAGAGSAAARVSAQAATAQWHAQARSLADACAHLAFARLFGNPGYGGNENAVLPTGTCSVAPVRRGEPQQDMSTVEAGGTAHGFSAHVHAVVRTQKRCTSASTLPFGIEVLSWNDSIGHE